MAKHQYLYNRDNIQHTIPTRSVHGMTMEYHQYPYSAHGDSNGYVDYGDDQSYAGPRYVILDFLSPLTSNFADRAVLKVSMVMAMAMVTEGTGWI